MINRPSTYAALVKSLEYSVADYPHNNYDPEWDNWPLRDVVEQGCLLVLSQLVERCGVAGLINVNFVRRWLAKEPWGDDKEERIKNFDDATKKDQRLSNLFMLIRGSYQGQVQLCEVGLLDKESVDCIREREEGDEDGDIRMFNGESTAGEDFDGMFVENARRARDNQTTVDDSLRRRHREAMVLRDGVDTRPLERGDIIQRER